MQPIIRLTNYLEEYKRLTYDYYAKTHNIVYSTYYQLNPETTQYDPHYLATYHKTGEYSGRRYRKIHLMPLILIQQVLPIMDGLDKGVLYSENTITAFSIDSAINMAPNVGDIVFFNIQGDYVTWEVVNIEFSGPLESPYYKCNIKQTRLRDGFEDQVDSEYMFVEYAKKIYEVEDAINYISLISRHKDVVHFLNSKQCYNHNLAYHIHEKYCFPELETILNTLESLVPVGNLTMTHDYNIPINPRSIFMLLCLPKLYDTSKTPLCTYKIPKERINNRLDVYINYTEYKTSTDIVLEETDITSEQNMEYKNKKLSGHISPFIKYNIYFQVKKLNSFGFEGEEEYLFDIEDMLDETHEDIVDKSLTEDNWSSILFGIKHLEFYSLLLYDYLCNPDRFMSTYTGPPDDTIMSKLIHEWLMFLHNGDTSYVSLTKIATNLFEAVVEYSIISSKLITLQQKDVVMLK